MRSETREADQRGRLDEKTDRRDVGASSAPFGFSSLVDCLNSLTIDVDDAERIDPIPLTQSLCFGCVPQSLHTVLPVCADYPKYRQTGLRPARSTEVKLDRGPPGLSLRMKKA